MRTVNWCLAPRVEHLLSPRHKMTPEEEEEERMFMLQFRKAKSDKPFTIKTRPSWTFGKLCLALRRWRRMQLVGEAVFYEVCKWFFSSSFCNTNPAELLQICCFELFKFNGSVAPSYISDQVSSTEIRKHKKNRFSLNRFSVSATWMKI